MTRPDEPTLAWLFPERMPGSGHSLQTRAAIAAVCLVVMPTMLCGFLLLRSARGTLEENLLRDSTLLAQTAAHLVAAHYQGDLSAPPALQTALDQAASDPRIAFFVVTDSLGRAIDARYNEPVAYHLYQRLNPGERLSPVSLNQSITLPGVSDDLLVVRRQLIRSASGGGSGDQPIGFLELGLHDPYQSQSLDDLTDLTIVLVATICLVAVPLALVWVNYWMRPLRRMLANTLRMTMGGPFLPIETHRKDEIGLLTRSFNAMAANLTSVQNALIESNELLERKVTARTAELDEANRRLVKEMRDKDQFLRAVTHDLGAPIRNITGIVQRLLLKHRDQLDRAVLEKLERIAANARAEADLVNDLLELSRLGKSAGKPVEIDLNQMIDSLGEQFACALEDRRIELVLDRPLPDITGDRNRIRQVFQNLLDNAIKYLPDDAAERRIHIGWKLIAAQRVAYVADSGRGIDAKDHRLIFDVFQRARYSGTPMAEGRGIGLAGVKAIVEGYGGQVWVESELGKGATFFFTLPEDPRQPEAGPRAATAAPALAAP